MTEKPNLRYDSRVKNPTRRSFLNTSVAAVAAACLPAAVLPRRAFGQAGGAQPKRAQAGGDSPVTLGMCSYTFRGLSRKELISALKELRISTINCKDVKDHLPSTSAEEERAAMADYAAAGIKVTACGTVYFPKDDDADIRAKFEYAKLAGVKIIVAGDPAPSVLPRIERFVKEYDIRLAIHNHGPEDKTWPSPLTILEAVKHMDPRIGCCIDVGHTMRAGTDVVDAIRKVGPRLFDVHMKDLAKADSKESQVPVGEGIMPVRRIFETLAEIHYGGYVDLEYEIHPENVMPGVIESCAYMHGVLNGLGYTA